MTTEIVAMAEIEPGPADYVNAVRSALRGLQVDPSCLTDPYLFWIVAEGHEIGLSPADVAGALVDAMRVANATTGPAGVVPR